MRTTVVGIGNVLLSDDGAGVWLARRLLHAYRFEPQVEILDGGTLGLGLVNYLYETDRLLVLDAIKSDAAPGSVITLHERDIPALLRATLSAHEATLCDLLAALTLLGKMPDDVVAIGIVPQSLAPSIALSAPVRDALPRAERAAIAQLAAWGVGVEALDVPRESLLVL